MKLGFFRQRWSESILLSVVYIYIVVALYAGNSYLEKEGSVS